MSNKIKIPINNIKYRLRDLFHDFLSHHRHHCSYYDNMDDDELMWLMQQQGYIFHDIDDGEDYANYYDYDDGDDGDVIWPLKNSDSNTIDAYAKFWNKEHNKKHKHRKGKRARLIDINEPYSGEEEEYVSYEEVGDDDGICDGKEIYYYPDYHDKDSRLEFSTLKAFNDFCDDNGYSIPTHISNLLIFNRVVHTCLHPQSREYGLYEIMAETSYGSLFYEVCEGVELDD